MAETPERIWAKTASAYSGYRAGPVRGGSWLSINAERDGTPYIRADLVDDAVKALGEARESIQLWADIASDATQTRHDPSDDLAPIDAALARIKGDVT